MKISMENKFLIMFLSAFLEMSFYSAIENNTIFPVSGKRRVYAPTPCGRNWLNKILIVRGRSDQVTNVAQELYGDIF